MRNIIIILITLLLTLLSGCSAYFNQPLEKQPARIGEEVFIGEHTRDINPVKPIVVGVYKFRDQTGQYKQVDAGISYSTAVTQGATTILIKALEDSGWFIPIERENISNLLNERQIIRSTRLEENNKGNKAEVQPLSPLLFAGIILEGGIISYDSNIITGGAGARYFGTGGSTQYRQDRITIYLRAVSTSTGRILKTVYVSKTILSQAIDINLFRYVKVKHILEVETGVSQNEPGQLAVKEAIEKAVESLIIEGVKDDLWEAREEQALVDRAIIGYEQEKRDARLTDLYERELKNRRGLNAVFVKPYVNYFNGDYKNSDWYYGGQLGYKQYLLESQFSAELSAGMVTLGNSPVFKENFFVADANIEYNVLPNDKLTPFIYLGGGALTTDNFNDFTFKFQYGVGAEFIPLDRFGFRVFAENNQLLSDDLDNKVHGSRDDSYWNFGIGVNFFLTK